MNLEPLYDRHKFKNGYALQIVITDNCNLNCYKCDHLCGNLNQQYNMTIKEANNIINIINSNFKYLKSIHLFGGEPLTNPDCIEILKLFLTKTNKLIRLHTNGLLLSTNIISNIFDLQKNNKDRFLLVFSSYPSTYQELNEISKILLSYKIKYENRFINNFNNIGFTKKENIVLTDNENFFNCPRIFSEEPTFTLYKNKIFRCCIGGSLYNLKEYISFECNNDYILLNELQHENDIFQLYHNPGESCKYCHSIGQCGSESFPWQTQIKINNSSIDDYFHSLKDMYLNDYVKYFNINHQTFNEQSGDILSHNANFDIYSTRRTQGMMDIFIPFSSNINASTIKNALDNQTFNKNCNFYFVSINASQQDENNVYSYLPPYTNKNINSFFLKSSNIEDGFYEMYHNSFCSKILILNLEQELQDLINNREYLEWCYNNKSVNREDIDIK